MVLAMMLPMNAAAGPLVTAGSPAWASSNPPVMPPAIDTLKPGGSAAQATPPSVKSNRRTVPLADGGWEAMGRMLSIGQRGNVTSTGPLRPVRRLPDGARVTTLFWRIDSDRPLPSGVMLAVCLAGKCVLLDGLAGTSGALAELPADNPLTLQVKVNGSGAIHPPILFTHYQILVNYRAAQAR